MSSLEAFTLFPNLPPEIRWAIWQLAVVIACPVEAVICVPRPVANPTRSTRKIPLPMPVTMHVCWESRLATQQSAVASFDIEDGAWLNPHREFCPDVDINYISINALNISSDHTLAMRIKDNEGGVPVLGDIGMLFYTITSPDGSVKQTVVNGVELGPDTRLLDEITKDPIQAVVRDKFYFDILRFEFSILPRGKWPV
ncbi:hypothetical protein F4781DRAFT_417466 [Annulohypoxylon bovei var. microspora]|nr:hypothetical protein F4781DRAFT_417466 [Annulohypoxylon bovei var. microspora]